jgi:UDP-N-acetyl-D-glucosamine dehydrogenase
MNDRLVAPGSTVAARLIRRFRTREASVAVIGQGYVGLPLACRMAEAGFHTIGLDIDRDKVARLERGESYLSTVPAERVRAARAAGFEPSADFAQSGEADALVICVPTPLTPAREPDLRYVTGTLESLLPHLRPGQLLSLESTTYPGTTEEVLRPRIEEAGLRIGEDFFRWRRR